MSRKYYPQRVKVYGKMRFAPYRESPDLPIGHARYDLGDMGWTVALTTTAEALEAMETRKRSRGP